MVTYILKSDLFSPISHLVSVAKRRLADTLQHFFHLCITSHSNLRKRGPPQYRKLNSSLRYALHRVDIMNFYKSSALAIDHLDKHQGSVKGSMTAAGVQSGSPGETKRILACEGNDLRTLSYLTPSAVIIETLKCALCRHYRVGVR